MCVSTPTVLADQNDCYDQQGELSLTTIGYHYDYIPNSVFTESFWCADLPTLIPKNKMILLSCVSVAYQCEGAWS